MVNTVRIKDITIGRPAPFVLIAGPCVIEDDQTTYDIAAALKQLSDNLNIPLIFKASYDKANRTSIDSYRGPGIKKGLAVLSDIRKTFGLPIISDVHQVSEVELAGEILDVIQIPAFLCRQTDLLVSAAKTGKPVNVKKGQFLAPWDMRHVVKKIQASGNNNIILTDRGVSFGYNNLVSDFRCVKIMQDLGCPVIFDATHSVQLPGGAGASSSGQREFAPLLARAAIAAGADGVFIETHTNPEKALSDGPNSMRLDDLEALLIQLKAIQKALQ
ncbi:MAG: 3-deoxy-8-phosphooctulonate synthase [Desulfobacteraceae bacterium]|nr:MAG: 3-deoxy-8-phosphooctulonate synthase [Desulfobacteraceae bacterium]